MPPVKKKRYCAKSARILKKKRKCINGNKVNFTNAQKVQKKAIPLGFRIATLSEVIYTKEGPIKAPKGSYIMTGTRGENWPIPAKKFKKTYNIDKKNNTASKKPIPVKGKQMKKCFFATVSWNKDKLNGRPGDWLIKYGPGDYGIVKKKIFNETYDFLLK